MGCERRDAQSDQLPGRKIGLSATSQQYFSLTTNQPPATNQQYFSLRTNQHRPSATSQTNRLVPEPELALMAGRSRLTSQPWKRRRRLATAPLPVLQQDVHQVAGAGRAPVPNTRTRSASPPRSASSVMSTLVAGATHCRGAGDRRRRRTRTTGPPPRGAAVG
jgi:hypothetical protein